MEATEKSVSRTDDDHPEDIDLVLSAIPKCTYPTVDQLIKETDLTTGRMNKALTHLVKSKLVRVRQDSFYGMLYKLVPLDGESVSPNQDRSSTGTVSPKVQPKVLSCPQCDFVTKSYAGLHIHSGQKHKTAATVKQKLKAKKKKHAADPPVKSESLVTIILTPEEALETGIALALADKIDDTRFYNSHKIAGKVLEALAEQIIDDAHLEAR